MIGKLMGVFTKMHIIVVVVAAIAFLNPVSAADPDMLQDICVADLKSDIIVNGFPCKANASAGDFAFSGLAKPGLTNNQLGSLVTTANVMQVPGLNTLGVSMARIDFAPGGVNPPHTHPRGTEMIFVLAGDNFVVGFVTTANVLFAKTLKMGDTFVFPRGLVHFQVNNGKYPAAVISAFNSHLPGTQVIANSLFAAMPPIPDDVLARAFRIDIEEVEEIKAKFARKYR